MPAEYDESELPPEEVTVSGKTWKREKFDSAGYQWARPMNEEEYSWDRDEVSLVGTETPIRVVELQYLDGLWHVSASETAGPEYHRPGFTEQISGEYSHTASEFTDAVAKVRQFIHDLSPGK